MTRTEQIAADALTLTPAERVVLVDRVLESLDKGTAPKQTPHDILGAISSTRPTFGVCPVGTTSAGAVKPRN